MVSRLNGSAALAATVLAGLTLFTSPVWAGPKKPRAKVTVFLIPQGNVSPKLTAKISHAIVKSLHDNRNLDVKDPDKLLVQFAGEVPSRTISRAESNLKKGIFLIKGGNPGDAIVKIQGAINGLEQSLAFVTKKMLARAFMALGVAQAEAGNRRAAQQTFVSLVTWRPRVLFDTKEFGPRYLPLFAKAQAISKRLPRGSAELSTDPSGAKAYVDGRFVGITPTTAFGLASGFHYATFKKEGFIKASKRIRVSGSEQQKYQQELKTSDKYLLLQQALGAVKNELGAEKATQAMADLRSFLFIDQVIFARIRQVGAKKLLVQGYLYDLRSKIRLNQASQTVVTGKFKAVAKMTTLLYVNVRYDGLLEAPPDAPPPPPLTRTPFYATWWFWSAAAVGAAAIIVGVVMIPESRSCEDGSRCITFRN